MNGNVGMPADEHGAPAPETEAAGVPQPRAPSVTESADHAVASVPTPRHAGRVAAVRRRFPDSAVGQLWHRLQLLDFINRGMLFAGILLLCLVPFMISVQALAGRSAATSIVRRLGLDQQAATAVGHVFTSPAAASGGVTGVSWVFLLLGGITVARAIQEIYEHAWRLERRGIRDTLRHLAWLCTLVAAGALAGWVEPWLLDHAGPVLDAAIALLAFTGFWWFTMWLLLAGRGSWRQLFPSAVATGICWLATTVFFRLTMSETITSDYASYGAVGVVFAAMSVLITAGVVIILGALAGLVWQERHTPRKQTAPSPQ